MYFFITSCQCEKYIRSIKYCQTIVLYTHHTQHPQFFNVLFSKFRLSYYPHRLASFDQLLEGIFGKDTEHVVWGDFKPKGEIETPAYFIHMIQKKAA